MAGSGIVVVDQRGCGQKSGDFSSADFWRRADEVWEFGAAETAEIARLLAWRPRAVDAVPGTACCTGDDERSLR